MEETALDVNNASNKRIASLDFIRGLAIFLMTFFHSFSHVFDHSWFIEDSEKIFDYPKIVLIPLVILLYLGTWNSFFLFISSCVNTIGMVKGANKRANLELMLIKRLITGIFLLIMDAYTEAILYNGYLGNAIINNDWNNITPLLDSFYKIKTLQIIGYSIIITSTTNYLLLKGNGKEKFRRNMRILTAISIIIFMFTPLIHNLVDNMPWVVPEGFQGWPEIEVQVYNASFKSWLMVSIAGNVEPLFPYLATGFVGSMLGYSLSKEEPNEHFARKWFSFSLALIASGLILALCGIPLTFSMRPSLPSYLIQLGGQVGVIMLFIYFVECKDKGDEFANNRFVRIFRRWGIIALSIYVLEIFDIIPGSFLNLILGKLSGVNFLHQTFGFDQIHFAFLVALHSMIWYEVLVRLWSRIDFKWSLEWLLLKIQYGFSKQKSNRLNVDYILNQVNWMNFKQKLKEEKLILKDKQKKKEMKLEKV